MSKKLCLNCKNSFNISFEDVKLSDFNCPQCDNEMVTVTHKFTAPRLDDHPKWEVVKFLIENGFPYHDISIYEDDAEGGQKFVSYAAYPDNMTDAVEFIAQHKDQALKDQN